MLADSVGFGQRRRYDDAVVIPDIMSRTYSPTP